MPVSPLAYLLLFTVPALLPLSWWVGQRIGAVDLAAWGPLIVLQLVVPLLDWWLGERRDNLPDDELARRAASRYFRVLPLLAVPVHLGVLLWAGWLLAVVAPFGLAGLIGWTLSTGYIAAIMAINVAHELIHKRSWLERLAGGVALSTVGYGTFKIEHVRGHHVRVATPQDPSSAALGQSLFRFLPLAVVRNVAHAWRLEHERLGRWLDWRNEAAGWTVLTVGWASLFAVAGGYSALGFFIGQALVAILSLETINYVEHYGLRRRRLDDGRYVRPDPTHSWNSDALLSNLFLLQLARHSDHHAHATRPYAALRHHDLSPQLPAGYASMFLLAWVPPLWRRVMDPLVPRHGDTDS